MASLQGYQRDFRTRFNAALREVPGRVTSFFRSVERNRQVGGSGSSQHLYGLAADVVVPRGWRARAIQRARRAGLVVIDEGDHLHVQYFRADRRPPWLR